MVIPVHSAVSGLSEGWPTCRGIPGQHGAESVADMRRNGWPACGGIGGRHQAEYASSGSFVGNVAGGLLSGGLDRELSLALGDNHASSWAGVTEDAFGNALGNAIIGEAEAPPQQVQSPYPGYSLATAGQGVGAISAGNGNTADGEQTSVSSEGGAQTFSLNVNGTDNGGGTVDVVGGGFQNVTTLPQTGEKFAQQYIANDAVRAYNGYQNHLGPFGNDQIELTDGGGLILSGASTADGGNSSSTMLTYSQAAALNMYLIGRGLNGGLDNIDSALSQGSGPDDWNNVQTIPATPTFYGDGQSLMDPSFASSGVKTLGMVSVTPDDPLLVSAEEYTGQLEGADNLTNLTTSVPVSDTQNGLTNDQLAVLKYYSDSGDRQDYWNYLANLGTPYAQLALGVVRNDTLNGYIANGYARNYASKLGVTMNDRDWNNFGIALMQADYADRANFLTNGNAADALNLPVQYIAQYHADTFTQFGLDAGAWTAYVPLEPYLKSGDYATAQTIFNNMMNPNFFTSSTQSVYADVAGVNGSNYGEHATWFQTVSTLAVSYASDPDNAYSNSNKIQGWSYDGDSGNWYQFVSNGLQAFGSPLASTRESVFVTAPSSLQNTLNADRAFRISNLIPMLKDPYDNFPVMLSR